MRSPKIVFDLTRRTNMGFDCKFCGEREIWAFESQTHPRVCWDCHRERYPETKEMIKHRECQRNANTPITK